LPTPVRRAALRLKSCPGVGAVIAVTITDCCILSDSDHVADSHLLLGQVWPYLQGVPLGRVQTHTRILPKVGMSRAKIHMPKSRIPYREAAQDHLKLNPRVRVRNISRAGRRPLARRVCFRTRHLDDLQVFSMGLEASKLGLDHYG
jgi:hypothetical protein